jgi:hypothetical protein
MSGWNGLPSRRRARFDPDVRRDPGPAQEVQFDEMFEYSLARVLVETPKAPCLRSGQAQSRHLQELRPDPLEQALVKMTWVPVHCVPFPPLPRVRRHHPADGQSRLEIGSSNGR